MICRKSSYQNEAQNGPTADPRKARADSHLGGNDLFKFGTAGTPGTTRVLPLLGWVRWGLLTPSPISYSCASRRSHPRRGQC